IQEHRFERLGENQVREVNIRIVASTNRDLEKEMEEGRFRRDLFYRLNVVPILLPPLREREGDVILITRALLERTCQRYDRRLEGISPEAVEALERYPWPGNVRELENLIERMVVLNDGELVNVTLESLPETILAAEDGFLGHAAAQGLSLDELEREYIKVVLARTSGHKAEAAQILGINRKTLLEKRKRYNLE
ncbi:MAG TPA: sigma-54-dependent Fis family transcriptional regulator, partial [Candidatus Coatesbacteria bacterium]|nr:sigma-54-dependent Fis family transcriptional regulator [Candidatus Coatesbacteria bacterium]